MTLFFHTGDKTKVQSVSIPSFAAFRDWLWSLGVGHDLNDPKMLEWWRTTYSKFSRDQFTPVVFGRGREKVGSNLWIVDLKNDTPTKI